MSPFTRSCLTPCLLLLSLCLPLLCHAAAPVSAQEIIKRIEDNLNGKTAAMKIVMIVKSKRTTRTIKMESYSIGIQKSFIKITYPKKDKGITFLKIDNGMWQYVPRIEKTIKIPASMMLQGWMGSDFTNDDLVRESSISDDYQSALTDEDEAHCTLRLTPNPDAAVVWGRIVMTVDKTTYFPTEVFYYDEDDTLIRILRYTEVKNFSGKLYPSRWVIDPQTEDKAGHQTIMEVSDVVFDQEIDASYFTKRALKRFSK